MQAILDEQRDTGLITVSGPEHTLITKKRRNEYLYLARKKPEDRSDTMPGIYTAPTPVHPPYSCTQVSRRYVENRLIGSLFADSMKTKEERMKGIYTFRERHQETTRRSQ